MSVSSGEIAIGQAVATNSNVQFANLTLSGNLTVNGATTVSSTNSVIADTLIELEMEHQVPQQMMLVLLLKEVVQTMCL